MCTRLLVAAILLVSAAGASGATRTLNCSEAYTIVNEEGFGRFLLDFGTLAEVDGEFIASAYLEFELPVGTVDRDWSFEVFTLGRSWRGVNPSWTQPWTRDGGDTDDTHSRRVQVLRGEQAGAVRVDMTGAVQAVVAGEDASNGFLVTAPMHERDGFTLVERTELNGLAEARLVIKTANPRAAGPLGRDLAARRGR